MTEDIEPVCDTTCPRCGRDDNVDNLGDGERLWCGRCQHDWVPKIEYTEPPSEYEHYTFTDDDGCPQESANVRLKDGDDAVSYEEAWRRHNAHPAVAGLREQRGQLQHDLNNLKVIAEDWEQESEMWERQVEPLRKALREAAAQLCVGCREIGDPEKHSSRHWHTWDDNDNGPEGRRCKAAFVWVALDSDDPVSRADKTAMSNEQRDISAFTFAQEQNRGRLPGRALTIRRAFRTGWDKALAHWFPEAKLNASD